MKTDQELLEIYIWGFNDELNGLPVIPLDCDLSKIAYHFGREDAIIGDDVSTSDLQTNEEILNKIKNLLRPISSVGNKSIGENSNIIDARDIDIFNSGLNKENIESEGWVMYEENEFCASFKLSNGSDLLWWKNHNHCEMDAPEKYDVVYRGNIPTKEALHDLMTWMDIKNLSND